MLTLLAKSICTDKDSIRRPLRPCGAGGMPDLDALARIRDWFLKRARQERRATLDQVVDLLSLAR